MVKLYVACFAWGHSALEMVPAEVEKDKQLTAKIESMDFVTLAHLEIPVAYVEHEPILELAQEGMSTLNFGPW